MSDFRNETPITSEQIAVFEQVKTNILREYKNFDMDIVTYCGAPACIGGHVSFVVNPDSRYDIDSIWDTALRFLNVHGSLDGSPLYWAGAQGWDEDLQIRYLQAERERNRQTMATVACEAIDRFIANTNAHFAEVSA